MNTQTTGFVQDKPNVVLGTVGALVGALIGAALWVLVYQLGYIAAIVGIAMIFLAYKGYTILARGKDKKGVIIATVISVIVLFLAHIFCWGLELYNLLAAEYEITFMDSLLSLPSLLASDSELMMSFVKDLVIGYVLMAVGSFSFVRNLARQADMPETVTNTEE